MTTTTLPPFSLHGIADAAWGAIYQHAEASGRSFFVSAVDEWESDYPSVEDSIDSAYENLSDSVVSILRDWEYEDGVRGVSPKSYDDIASSAFSAARREWEENA